MLSEKCLSTSSQKCLLGLCLFLNYAYIQVMFRRFYQKSRCYQVLIRGVQSDFKLRICSFVIGFMTPIIRQLKFYFADCWCSICGRLSWFCDAHVPGLNRWRWGTLIGSKPNRPLRQPPLSSLQDDHIWHLISALHKQGWTLLMTHAYGWAFTGWRLT